MGFFDKLKTKNAVQINEVSKVGGFCSLYDIFDFFKSKKGKTDYSLFYLWICLEKIVKGLSNVSYTTSKDNIVANNIVWFINNNYALMLNSYVKLGFIAVRYDKLMNYSVLCENDIKKDAYGRVINKNTVVVYSHEYQTSRKSPLTLCRPILHLLNQLGNTLEGTTNTMNVLPIISGQAIPANPKFKEELSNAMTNDYGFGDNQMRYFLSTSELKVDTIDLGIDKLNLKENITAKFKELLNYWEIPTILVLDDASTYNNIVEARKEFYNNCIRFYAEQFLLVGQALLTASDELIPKSTLNYRFSNVPEMENTISGYCSEQAAYLDLLGKFREQGIYVDDDIKNLYEKVKKEIKNV